MTLGMRRRVGIFRGRRPAGSHRGATTLLPAPRHANPPPRPDTSNIVVTTFEASTIALSLIGDQDVNRAATLLRIGRGELPHCDKLIIDFRSTERLSDEVINALIDLVGEARTQRATLQLATRSGTYAHDVLELFGILDKVDSTDGWLPPFVPAVDDGNDRANTSPGST